MKNTTFKIKPLSLALLLAGIGMAQASHAIDLMAVEGQWSPDGGATQIPMWGFATDTGDCATAPTVWDVGPVLTDDDLLLGDLTIKLRNCLVNDAVSIVIPGQPASFTPETTVDGDGRTRITSFTHEAAADGGTAIYTWTGVKDGTYLYQSGSHPAKQVQMGLYGALTIKGASYPVGTTSGDVTLLYSEIDPVLHSPPAAATPLGYKPRHYLVNGSASQPVLTAGDTNLPTVLRFLNAGLDFHVPTLNGGHMTLVAEDGNAYPFPKVQYSANLAAGKTIDALWQPASAGDHVIYDRRGNGMVASLTVAAGVGQPIANNDVYSVDEGVSLEVLISFDTDGVTPLTGVLANDTASDATTVLTVPPASATLVSSTSSGILALNTDGSLTYTPYDLDFNGVDSFTYNANDGTLDSNIASVTITVDPLNDAPVANDDAYDALESETLNVAALGVLGNDTDVDGDTLVVGAVNGISTDVGVSLTLDSGATLTQNADGSLEYTPFTGAGSSDSFTYDACDAEPLCDTATVNITIVSSAPVAVDDAYAVIERTPRNVAALGVLGNDTDPNGDALNAVLDAGPILGALSCPTDTLLQLCSDGSFVYTPDVNAVPGDTASFTYFANDGTDNSAAPATVTLTITVNSPPVAVEDSATVTRNTLSVFINLTDNDSDPDSNLKDELGNVQAGQIDITTGTTTTRGGTVTVVTDGVNYTPKKNFRGTDTFSYKVTDLTDLPNGVSNEVTVRVNVVK